MPNALTEQPPIFSTIKVDAGLLIDWQDPRNYKPAPDMGVEVYDQIAAGVDKVFAFIGRRAVWSTSLALYIADTTRFIPLPDPLSSACCGVAFLGGTQATAKFLKRRQAAGSAVSKTSDVNTTLSPQPPREPHADKLARAEINNLAMFIPSLCYELTENVMDGLPEALPTKGSRTMPTGQVLSELRDMDERLYPSDSCKPWHWSRSITTHAPDERQVIHPTNIVNNMLIDAPEEADELLFVSLENLVAVQFAQEQFLDAEAQYAAAPEDVAAATEYSRTLSETIAQTFNLAAVLLEHRQVTQLIGKITLG